MHRCWIGKTRDNARCVEECGVCECLKDVFTMLLTNSRINTMPPESLNITRMTLVLRIDDKNDVLSVKHDIRHKRML